MKVLLDTHTFLWWQSLSSKLSRTAFETINNKENDVFISVVNAWELQIKSQKGKLKLERPLPLLIQRQQDLNGFKLLNVNLKHIYELESLPLYHADPFDRLLMAQAKTENFHLLTNDPKMNQYDINVLW